MPPKRRAERSSTRERVIQAADRLWGLNGARGASLDDIAREASVTKPTVYYYFRDKSALFTAVICSVLEEHGAGLKTAAHRGGRARRSSPIADPRPGSRAHAWTNARLCASAAWLVILPTGQ